MDVGRWSFTRGQEQNDDRGSEIRFACRRDRGTSGRFFSPVEEEYEKERRHCEERSDKATHRREAAKADEAISRSVR